MNRWSHEAGIDNSFLHARVDRGMRRRSTETRRVEPQDVFETKRGRIYTRRTYDRVRARRLRFLEVWVFSCAARNNMSYGCERGRSHLMNSFYAPCADGTTFMNVQTGETHACFERCDRSETRGDRVVCPLSNVVLSMTDGFSSGTTTRKRPRFVDEKPRDEIDVRRRWGYRVVSDVLKNSTENERITYVNMAMRVYDWLEEKFPFDAVTCATLMCACEGASTDAVIIPKRMDLYDRILPLRRVGKLGIKQNAVTKAYTTILKKRKDEVLRLDICD